MKKHLFSLLGISTTLILPVTSMFAQQTKRANVIFILADDIGYGDLSCYGARTIHTPNVDKLASRGILFTDAHG